MSTINASPASQPAPVFFIGLPKGGSTTFHSLMGSLDVPSFHVGGGGYLRNLDQPTISETMRRNAGLSCTSGDPRPRPNYIPALHLTGDANVYCMATQSGYRAFADDPWPLLWPYVVGAVPNSKFVLWEREPAQWAASAVRYFDDEVNWDWLRFYYGACNMSLAYETHLEGVARSHYLAVRAHFLADDAPAELRQRLLIVDYQDRRAGRRVCEFVLGDGAPRCADVDRMPRALPEKLLEGSGAERVKMPLGRPDQIAPFGACVRDFEAVVGGTDRRNQLMARAWATAAVATLPGIFCRGNGTDFPRPCPSSNKALRSAGKPTSTSTRAGPPARTR